CRALTRAGGKPAVFRARSKADASADHRRPIPLAGAVMTEPGDGLSLEEITAALRADSADVALYARVLTESLGDALPAGCVVVDRDRTMSDRMRGRPGQVTKVTVRLGEKVLNLAVQPGRTRRRPLPPARWHAGMGGRTGQGTGRPRTAERTRGRGVAQARRRFLAH